MEIGVILGLIKAGLDLWDSHEANKYRDKLIALEKDYYAELRKPFEDRSQLALDNIMLEIDLIAKNFIQFSTKKS
jgi:hypothetical protein